MWKRRLVWVAAVLAVPLALALAALAVDVLRAPGALADDDVRFEAAPRRSAGLWDGLGFLPGKPAEHALELGDDLAYRRTMANFLRVEPGRVEIFGPELENLLGQVQRELIDGSASDSNPTRRSQYLNFQAVIQLQRFGTDPNETASILRSAVNTLRSAVETDPSNTDAKLNLELALRSAKATNVPGIDPSGGAAEGTISGQGRSGSGY